MDSGMKNPKRVPRKTGIKTKRTKGPLQNTRMTKREKKLAVLLEKKRQMDVEIEALRRDQSETESDPDRSTAEGSAVEVEHAATREGETGTRGSRCDTASLAGKT
jgi:hypothetical protein